MKIKSGVFYLRHLILPLLIFILIALTGISILFSQIASGNEALRTWTDISIILIALFLFIPGLTFLFFLIWLIHIFTRVNQKLPVWFERIHTRVVNSSTFIISFARALPRPFIIFDSIINFLSSLINKK